MRPLHLMRARLTWRKRQHVQTSRVAVKRSPVPRPTLSLWPDNLSTRTHGFANSVPEHLPVFEGLNRPGFDPDLISWKDRVRYERSWWSGPRAGRYLTNPYRDRSLAAGIGRHAADAAALVSAGFVLTARWALRAQDRPMKAAMRPRHGFLRARPGQDATGSAGMPATYSLTRSIRPLVLMW